MARVRRKTRKIDPIKARFSKNGLFQSIRKHIKIFQENVKVIWRKNVFYQKRYQEQEHAPKSSDFYNISSWLVGNLSTFLLKVFTLLVTWKGAKVYDFPNGQHETQFSEGEEADLLKEKDDCKKNPGHGQFIPIERFQIEDLPEGHRDNDLWQLIRAVADITVRVDVRVVSPNRPEFWPDKEVRYPFYDMRERNVPRRGTGEVDKVIKFTRGCGCDHMGNKYQRKTTTCPCEKCRNSDDPSKVWWEIFIDTAAHVVFDETEAKHTSCRLFYDSYDSPIVTFDSVSIDHDNIEGDWCVLNHVTCDTEVADRMHRKFLHWVRLRDRVYEKVKYAKSSDKLTFIVSHPHGCPKQVSIGKWTVSKQLGAYKEYILSNLTYTTCTCPGSSGATVHCVGYYWDHLHSGTYDYGLNYSGVGAVLRMHSER